MSHQHGRLACGLCPDSTCISSLPSITSRTSGGLSVHVHADMGIHSLVVPSCHWPLGEYMPISQAPLREGLHLQGGGAPGSRRDGSLVVPLTCCLLVPSPPCHTPAGCPAPAGRPPSLGSHIWVCSWGKEDGKQWVSTSNRCSGLSEGVRGFVGNDLTYILGGEK